MATAACTVVFPPPAGPANIIARGAQNLPRGHRGVTAGSSGPPRGVTRGGHDGCTSRGTPRLGRARWWVTLSGGGRERFPRILVVEDDEDQLLALTLGLEREGMAVTGVRSGREALLAHDEVHPDLVLLDVMLGGTSGVEVCRQLRARGETTPIIMVSSRHDEVDVVVGIEMGADDYLAKPYRLRELVARIGVLLRRRRLTAWLEGPPPGPSRGAAPIPGAPHVAGRSTAARPPGSVLRAGDIVLDEDRHEVEVGGRKVDLALREFQVLRELLSARGRVVTRDALLERVWGLDYEGDPRIVSTLIGRLRAEVELDPANPTRIVTIRGVGYRLDGHFC